jgi:hypothetical protein
MGDKSLYSRRGKPIVLETFDIETNNYSEVLQLELQWDSNEIVGLILVIAGKQKWYDRDRNSCRLLFFRQLENAGQRERIELILSNNVFSGDIRQNISPWCYDDWEIMFLLFEKGKDRK